MNRKNTPREDLGPAKVLALGGAVLTVVVLIVGLPAYRFVLSRFYLHRLREVLLDDTIFREDPFYPHRIAVRLHGLSAFDRMSKQQVRYCFEGSMNFTSKRREPNGDETWLVPLSPVSGAVIGFVEDKVVFFDIATDSH